MAISKERKAELTKEFGTSETDTGSAKVQVALLTENINSLTGHFQTHKKDHAGRRGLLKMVGQRRNLLNYIRKQNVEDYRTIIKQLDLRK